MIKIGKIAFLFVALACFYLGATSLEIALMDTQGAPVSIMQMGQTYLLEVSIDQEADLRSIRFQHIDSIELELRNVSRINVMSSVKTQQVYLVRPRLEGSHTIGPAFFRLGSGSVVRSNALNVQIVKHAPQQQQPVFLSVESSNDSLLIGVPAQLTLTLYTRSSLHLVGLEKPIIDQSVATISECIQGKQGIVEKNGIQYQFQQWYIEIIPHKEGSLSIAPFAVRIRKSQGNSIGGGIFHALLYGMQEERISSNELTLSVQALPAYNGIVHGIGRVTNFSACMDQATFSQGEGFVLTLKIQGDTTISRFIQPSLELPEGLRYYPSTERYIPNQDEGKASKTFEYVLQGIKPGHYIIPSQTLVYFDLDAKEYKILSTEQISIRVNQTSSFLAEPSTESTCNTINQPDAQVNVGNRYRASPFPIIPLTIFWALIIILSIILFGHVSWLYWFYRIQSDNKRALRMARMQLRSIQQAQGLYPLIINLFAQLLSASPGQVTHDMILDWFDKKGASTGLKEGWHRYFDQVCNAAFGTQAKSVVNDQELLQGMRVWLDKVQELLDE